MCVPVRIVCILCACVCVCAFAFVHVCVCACMCNACADLTAHIDSPTVSVTFILSSTHSLFLCLSDFFYRARVHFCTHAHARPHTHARTQKQTHTHKLSRTNAHTITHTHTRIYTHTKRHINKRTHTHTQADTHTKTHTRTHTHIHTQLQTHEDTHWHTHTHIHSYTNTQGLFIPVVSMIVPKIKKFATEAAKQMQPLNKIILAGGVSLVIRTHTHICMQAHSSACN